MKLIWLIIFIILKLNLSVHIRPLEDDLYMKYQNSQPKYIRQNLLDRLKKKIVNKMKQLQNNDIDEIEEYEQDENIEELDEMILSRNTTILANLRMNDTEKDGDYIGEERTVKFYISSNTECNILINDTIQYYGLFLQNPILHTLKGSKIARITPVNVLSNDLNVDYYAYSKRVKTFSTYWESKLDKPSVSIQYMYSAKNIIESHSDFTNDLLLRI